MSAPPTDSKHYLDKKAFFERMLTIYGRKPILEALQDNQITIYRLHCANTNQKGDTINAILKLAAQRGIEVCWHDRAGLSRISKNQQQDQGVAADLQLENYQSFLALLKQPDTSKTGKARFIALDKITNPQNLGMIIRSVCAGYVDGLILPRKGCAALSPLVIKASAGTLFKAPIYFCDQLPEALSEAKQQGFTVYTLSSYAKQSLFEHQLADRSIFVLGNETDGVSAEAMTAADMSLNIPMRNGVESLNVAITAALIAFQC